MYSDEPPVKTAPVVLDPTKQEKTRENIHNGASRVPHTGSSESENALATFFDVAVLRCLFVSHWTEEGVYWALTFFHKRLKNDYYLISSFND